MSWVQVVLDFLRQFWPFEIVYSYQQGVRFWCGHDRKKLAPGLYMFVPFFGKIEVMDVKTDVIRLQNQNLTTLDGQPVSVSANVTYHIDDARKAFTNVQQIIDNLADECRTGLARGVRDYEYDELLTAQGEMEEDVAQAIQEAAEEWGVTIHRVTLVDFVKTKNISLTRL